MNEEQLVTVRLLGFPVQVHARASEHAADLRREFQLLLEQVRDHQDSVAHRLVEIFTMLSDRYDGFTAAQEQQINDAIDRGAQQLGELVFTLPSHAGEAARQMGAILDETDALCRDGKLLTLSPPDDLVAYRTWYLDNFITQCAGGAPTPWTGPLA